MVSAALARAAATEPMSGSFTSAWAFATLAHVGVFTLGIPLALLGAVVDVGPFSAALAVLWLVADLVIPGYAASRGLHPGAWARCRSPRSSGGAAAGGAAAAAPGRASRRALAAGVPLLMFGGASA